MAEVRNDGSLDACLVRKMTRNVVMFNSWPLASERRLHPGPSRSLVVWEAHILPSNRFPIGWLWLSLSRCQKYNRIIRREEWKTDSPEFPPHTFFEVIWPDALAYWRHGPWDFYSKTERRHSFWSVQTKQMPIQTSSAWLASIWLAEMCPHELSAHAGN